MILGYARVSKGEAQDTRMQETALRAAGVERLFTEQASGGRWARPHLHRLKRIQTRPEQRLATWVCERGQQPKQSGFGADGKLRF